MLSIPKPIKGAKMIQYYLELAQTIYYSAGVEPAGVWFGGGAEKMSLAGNVKPETFRNLLLGFSPDGTRPLVQNANQKSRQCGWDLTFSPPKCFSVLWAMAPPELKQTLEEIERQVLQKVLAVVEKECGVTRRGQQGTHEEPAALVFAMFHHCASRALDPQYHTHVVVPNIGLRLDRTTGTIQSIHFFRQKMRLGALYQQELVKALRHLLGLIVEQERVGFHIVGVPRELCNFFSKRRREIEQVMKELGLDGAVAAKIVTLITRPAKEQPPRQELFARWQEVGQAFGWGAAQAQQLVQPRGRQLEAMLPIVVPASQTAAITRREGILPARPQRLAAELPPGTVASSATKKAHPLRAALPSPLGEDNAPDANRSRGPRNSSLAQKGPGWVRVEWRRLLDKTPWVPARQRLFYTEWRSLFPAAPFATIRNLKLPVVVAELPRITVGPPRQYNPRWWSIYWKRNLFLGELRLQQRILFPKAPQWSPLHKLSFPAFRPTFHKSKSLPLRQWNENDIGHSH